jgi:hypothetical protein
MRLTHLHYYASILFSSAFCFGSFVRFTITPEEIGNKGVRKGEREVHPLQDVLDKKNESEMPTPGQALPCVLLVGGPTGRGCSTSSFSLEPSKPHPCRSLLASLSLLFLFSSLSSHHLPPLSTTTTISFTTQLHSISLYFSLCVGALNTKHQTPNTKHQKKNEIDRKATPTMA